MGRTASKKERIDILEKTQKNGTTYVYQRISVYDKDKGYYVSKEQKLLGKKEAGSDDLIATRPKSPDGSRKTYAAERKTSVSGITAARVRVGTTRIIEHIGKTSGIDADVMASCDEATAKKILAIARYYLHSDGEAISHIEKWQLTHLMEPYGFPLSADAAHDLFVRVGSDETITQSVFFNRASHLDNKQVLAYDATTVSTYDLNHNRVRYGYNKSGDGLETDKIFTFYSMTTRQPVCFTTVVGNIPDVIAIENATKQLEVLGLRQAEIITDCGFYSERNLSLLFGSSFQFITRAQYDVKWIRPEVDRILEEIGDTGHMSPDEPGTYGVTVCLKHDFVKTRKYASKSKGLEAGTEESFQRRIYLHVFMNDVNQIKKNRALDDELNKLKKAYERGEREFKPAAQKMIENFFIIKAKRNGNVDIRFNVKAIREKKKYNGVFVLAASSEKDTFEALRKFRRREWIEDFFEEYKQRIGGGKYRVWDDLTLDGKKLVQFVALCYYEHFSSMLREIKGSLGEPNGDNKHDQKGNLNKEKQLKTWLENTSIQEMFDWYDAIEKIDVATPYAKQTWTTEVIERDQLFLKKLGISLLSQKS
jgi:transposase